MEQPADQRVHRLPTGLVLRLAVVALVVVVVVFLVSGSHEQHTVSEVINEVHRIALAKPQGGLIGSWWVSAAGIDPDTGRLLAFKIECGPIHIAARSARVIVNPHDDSFQFEMWDVVMARVSDEGGPDDDVDTLRRRDRYVLGPLPYTVDIVPDEGPAHPPPLTLTDE
jgi:hypothetical protein